MPAVIRKPKGLTGGMEQKDHMYFSAILSEGATFVSNLVDLVCVLSPLFVNRHGTYH